MKALTLTVLTMLATCGAAHADLSISNMPTQNMDCQSGVCTATAKGANLNVSDLTSMLAAADTTVRYGGGALAIQVLDGFSWTSTSRLALDAQTSIGVHKPVVVAGQGGLTLTYNDGGSEGDLKFFDKGKIDFGDLSSKLTINGNRYVLVGDLKTLAGAVASNPSGFYALAADYDAKADGTYRTEPITTYFTGVFEGLGNAITNLTIAAVNVEDEEVGLFRALYTRGVVRDLKVLNANISSPPNAVYSWVGVLAGRAYPDASVIGVFVTGIVTGYHGGEVGGLVGGMDGKIDRSAADCSVTGVDNNDGQYRNYAGGLVGLADGPIERSFATGAINGDRGWAGGLAGFLFGGVVSNSYAMGSVSAVTTGGLIGQSKGGRASASYSTGRVYGTDRNKVGGYMGRNIESPPSEGYWDVDTSRRKHPCGRRSNAGCDGIKGLTDIQLKSALPPGFDPKIWGSDPKINNGYPHLLANPPQ